MQQADRVQLLGVETAFAVAERAAARAKAGKPVYPFHLGDLNIPTPQNIVDAAEKALRDGKFGYCPPAGIAPLRDALAQDSNKRKGTSYSMENVSVQPGGKPVIGKFLKTLMNPGDEVLCPNPGYPIYESQIRFQGGVVVSYPIINAGDYFTIDFDALEKAITPKTKLMIVNDYHNPTAAECTEAERERLAELAQKHDLKLLLDEAYSETHYDNRSASLVSLPGMEERCVLLYTFSKKYAMTGWRLGAALGPREIIDTINTLNVNAESCTTQFVQWAGVEGVTGDQSGPKKIVDILRERRDAAHEILSSIPGITCVKPNAAFYLYPDVTELMARKGYADDYDGFVNEVMEKTGVALCARKHFGTPLPGESRRYLRLAYSGINVEDIREGLAAFKKYAE